MSRLTEYIESQLSDRLRYLSLSTPGTLIEFDHKTYTATIAIVKSTGKGSTILKLPWPQEQLGVYSTVPPLGSKVIIGFREGNDNFPYVISTYDPEYETNTLEARRDLDRATWSDLSFLVPSSTYW